MGGEGLQLVAINGGGEGSGREKQKIFSKTRTRGISKEKKGSWIKEIR